MTIKEPSMDEIKEHVTQLNEDALNGDEVAKAELDSLLKQFSQSFDDDDTVCSLVLYSDSVKPATLKAFGDFAETLRFQEDLSIKVKFGLGLPTIVRAKRRDEVLKQLENNIYWRQRSEYNKAKEKEQEANMPRGASPHLTPSSTPSVS